MSKKGQQLEIGKPMQKNEQQEITEQDSKGQKKFRTAYGPKAKVNITFHGEGMTKQSFKDEADINVIMSRFEKTGIFPMPQNELTYGDVTGLEFQQSMQIVRDAQLAFDLLPAKVRDRFANDPGELLTFLDDENNREEALRLGLINPKPAADPPAPAKSTTAILEPIASGEKAVQDVKPPVDK